MKQLALIKLLVFAGLLNSCSTINEVHYFKDKISASNSATKIIPNYYRVKITGSSFLSSSRYISGYFDQTAINLYFNQFAQPTNGKLFGTADSSSAFANEDGKELVLIFSTNAKAVSDQIGAIAKNQVVLNSMSTILQKNKLEEAVKIKADLKEITADKDLYIFKTDLYLKDISKKTEKEKKLVIDQFLKNIN
jgi:hypothetical protein